MVEKEAAEVRRRGLEEMAVRQGDGLIRGLASCEVYIAWSIDRWGRGMRRMVGAMVNESTAAGRRKRCGVG